MKSNTLKKSSFTLPSSQVSLVTKLKKTLHLKSNTEVVRRALQELQNKVERQALRQQFVEASRVVREANRQDMAELDQLAGEGIS